MSMSHVVMTQCIFICILMVNLITSINTQCYAVPDHVVELDECIVFWWRVKEGCPNRHLQLPLNVLIDSCDGTPPRVYSLHASTTDQRAFAIERNICQTQCIVYFSGSNERLCTMYHSSSHFETYKQMSHCMGRNAVNCISVSNAQLCQAQSNDATELIEHLPIHEIESSDGPHVCTNFRNHSCITTSDVENCLIHDQGIDNNSDILLNKYCIFNGNKTNILSRCNEGIKSDCLSILQSLSRTSIYSQQDSVCLNGSRTPTCADFMLLQPQTRPVEDNQAETAYQPSILPATASNHEALHSANMTLSAVLAIIIAFRLSYMGHSLSQSILILVISWTSAQALQFREENILIHEGHSPRAITIERANLLHSVEVKLFVTTIGGYLPDTCNLTLDDLGVNQSQIDQAEDSDFLMNEYELLFEAGVHNLSITLEIYDDNISESEEVFIVYLNNTESPSDRCAIIIKIIDNDGLMFNFSSSQLIIDESIGEYLNLSIVKIGKNEANVTVKIGVDLESSESASTTQRGLDFEVLEEYYTFTSETVEKMVQLVVYDDLILEVDEVFHLRLSVYNSNVMFVTDTYPNSVKFVVHDNEVAVAGFTHDGDIELQEGGESARVCVALEPENLLIDEKVYFIFTIIVSSSSTGHDLLLEPSPNLYIDKFGRQDCIDVSSIYDANLNESHHTLTFQIRDTTVRKVKFSRQVLDIYVMDLHGLVFISEPRNVSVGVGQEAHFECVYRGTHAAPIWNITNPGGSSKIVSTGKLPHKHFSKTTGLVIKDVDESHNMTSYSCLFQIYNRKKVEIVASAAGMLIVLETITFDMHISNYINHISNRTLNLVKGDSPPLLQITKQGYSAESFIVILSIRMIQEYNHAVDNQKIIWIMFNASKHEHTIPVLVNELRQENNYIRPNRFEMSIIQPVRSIEDGSPNVIVADSLYINIFDNASLIGIDNQDLTRVYTTSECQKSNTQQMGIIIGTTAVALFGFIAFQVIICCFCNYFYHQKKQQRKTYY